MQKHRMNAIQMQISKLSKYTVLRIFLVQVNSGYDFFLDSWIENNFYKTLSHYFVHPRNYFKFKLI